MREVVLRRVARLGPQATEVLGLAAVMGVSFPVAALAPAGGFVREDVADVLDRAVAARLLTAVDRGGRASFAHALIRQTLYDELGPVARAHLHELVAQTLESHQRRAEARSPPSSATTSTRRATRSAPSPPSATRARRPTARPALSPGRTRRTQLERALELDAMPEPSDPDGRCELLLAARRDAPARRASRLLGARSSEAAELARGRSTTQLARAAIRYGGHYYEAGVVDPTLIALLREALAELSPEEQDLRARVLARLAEILHFAGDVEASLALAREAVEIAQRARRPARAGRRPRGPPRVAPAHLHLRERLGLSEELIQIAKRSATASARCRTSRRASST